MKKIIIIWILLIPALWIFYVGFAFLFSNAYGKNFNLVETGIIAAVYSIVIPLVTWIGYSYSIFPRIKYIENNDIGKPSFKDTISSTVDIHQEFDFNSLKTEIANKWTITFSDEVEKILKFRTKIGFFKFWGTATRLQFDSNAGKLYLDSFTLTGHRHELARNMQKEIEKLPLLKRARHS